MCMIRIFNSLSCEKKKFKRSVRKPFSVIRFVSVFSKIYSRAQKKQVTHIAVNFYI